jgi:hypothetical protein
MGYYINPSDGRTKESWLAEHATPITKTEANNFDFSKGMLPVCLVDNGEFTAAGIAYDARERNYFMIPDGRPKKWFSVKKDLLKEWYNK